MDRTDLAHHEWDRRWKTTEGRADWVAPDPEVVDVIPALKQRGFRDVLDLGCGVGRHSILLASEGFNVTAMDGSHAGLDFASEEAALQRLEISTVCAEMTHLPFNDQSFDYLLAWNVIYHGDLTVVKQAISEIHRILRPGGFAHLTMLSDRNSEIATGEFISEGTYINPGLSDKAHPHYYCNAMKLAELFSNFRIAEQIETEHSRPGSFHWHLLLEK